jgi:hypothetical protein
VISKGFTSDWLISSVFALTIGIYTYIIARNETLSYIKLLTVTPDYFYFCNCGLKANHSYWEANYNAYFS